MPNEILRLHSRLTVVITVITITILFRLVWGISKRQPYGRWTERMMLFFSGLSTFQWLVGGLLLINLSDFGNLAFWSHAGTMSLAVIVSYLPLRWRKLAAVERYRRALIVVITVVVLVIIGVALLFIGHKSG